MKEKYPFITKMNTNDVLRDLLENADDVNTDLGDIDNRLDALEGKKLYQHVVQIGIQHSDSDNSYQSMLTFLFITDSDTAFTKQTFINHLNSICGEHTKYFMGQGFIIYTAGDLAGKYGFTIQLSYVYDTESLGSHYLSFRYLINTPALRNVQYDAVNFVSSADITNFNDDITLVA